MRHYAIFTLVLAVLASLTLAAAADELKNASAGGELDGNTYIVDVIDNDKKTEDTLEFSKGMFFSTECEQYGFTPAPYTSKTEDGKTTFESTIKSPAEGKAEWKGTVDGDDISGTFVWTKEGQDPVEYPFEGSIKE